MVNLATPDPDEPVHFRTGLFDRSQGARIYTLNCFDELVTHASANSDLSRLCALVESGRLDGRVRLEISWRDAPSIIAEYLNRRTTGKVVLHVD